MNYYEVSDVAAFMHGSGSRLLHDGEEGKCRLPYGRSVLFSVFERMVHEGLLTLCEERGVYRFYRLSRDGHEFAADNLRGGRTE